MTDTALGRLLLAAALCGLLAGCSAGGRASSAAPPAATRPAAPSPAVFTPTPPAPAASPPAGAVPVLGDSRGITRGYGSARPATIDNGGDSTGIVTGVTWQSWGGAQATGTGTAYYDPPGKPFADAFAETATVVAFDLGTCDGVLMYQAVEWYFPETGGSFDPGTYLDDCSWTFRHDGT